MDSFQSLILYIYMGSAQNGHISNLDHFYLTFTPQEFLHKFACRLRLKPMLVLLIKVRYCMLNTVSFIWNTHAADVSVQVEKSASHITNINNTVVVAVRIAIKIPWWQISKKSECQGKQNKPSQLNTTPVWRRLSPGVLRQADIPGYQMLKEAYNQLFTLIERVLIFFVF